MRYMYTQSQKKRTVESCASFVEECRYMNFVVYFIQYHSLLAIRNASFGKNTTFAFIDLQTTLLGSPDLDAGSQVKPINLLCVSYETECTHEGKCG